jgi:hypothetical protein
MITKWLMVLCEKTNLIGYHKFNSKMLMEHILQLFFKQLVDELQYTFLQLDSATHCTTKASDNILMKSLGI